MFFFLHCVACYCNNTVIIHLVADALLDTIMVISCCLAVEACCAQPQLQLVKL